MSAFSIPYTVTLDLNLVDGSQVLPTEKHLKEMGALSVSVLGLQVVAVFELHHSVVTSQADLGWHIRTRYVESLMGFPIGSLGVHAHPTWKPPVLEWQGFRVESFIISFPYQEDEGK